MLSEPIHPADDASLLFPVRSRMPAREKRAVLFALSLLLDCAAVAGGYFVALLVRAKDWLGAEGLPIVAIAVPVFLMFSIAREVQSVASLESRSVALQRSLSALVATALLVLAFSFFLKAEELSRLGYAVMFVGAAMFIVLSKLIENFLFTRWMGGSALATIVVQDGLAAPTVPYADTVDLVERKLSPDLDDPTSIDAVSRLMAPYDRVIIACSYERRGLWSVLLKSQDVGGEILLDRDLLYGAVAVGSYVGEDTLVMSRGPLNLMSRFQKRTFDLVLTSLALILLSPLLIAVAIAIKLEDGGPIFFRQLRVGQGSRHFQIFKFRSMAVDRTDSAGTVSAARDDCRVTKVGRFIRRTSIDELPQLLNVILGHMSLVGPRPHALGSLAGEHLFWQVDENYWIRHALKPGLTGLAQVRGYRGATDTPDALRKRVSSDLEYLSTWSLSLDVIIIGRTLRVLVHPNAY